MISFDDDLPNELHYLESLGPWVPEIGYVLSIKPERLEELRSELSVSRSCSVAIPKLPPLRRRKPMLCLISTKRGLITHVARSQASYPAETGRDRLELWVLISLNAPVSKSQVKNALSGRQSFRVRAALASDGHLSEAAFSICMAAIKEVAPDAFRIATSLINRKPGPVDQPPTPGRVNWAYQRDATITALEIARIPRSQLQVAPQLDEAVDPKTVTSIFDDIGDLRAIEDNLILNDLDAGAPDWTFLKSQRFPAKVFTSGETILTVILANKQDLEKQLGVDLIYVNEHYKAVVFVQYKMFKGVDGEGGYRPDNQMKLEIARMDAAEAALAKMAPDTSCDGYRLGPDPFFLKLCSKLLTHDAEGHVPGCYLPLSYWKRLAVDPRSQGPKGGTIVFKETLGRYFTPTIFTEMVAKGWIGATALQAAVLVPYLAAALRGDRGVVLAIEGKKTEDELGPTPPVRRQSVPKKRPAGQTAPVIQL